MIKVGDEVTVKNKDYLPYSYSLTEEKIKFTVVFINRVDSVVLDVTMLGAGWPRTSIGEGTYWNIGTSELCKVPRTILIGGKLL